MNRSKRLYLLLGILAVVCAVTFIVCRYEEKKEQIKNSDEVLLKIEAENVTSLSWENETESLSFHKEESWIYDKDEAFPVSEDKVNELLELFREFGVSFVIEEVEDYGQYGLDDPICTINIETEDKKYEIKLGDYSKMDSERYVSIGDGNVYLVKNDPLESYDAGLSDMIAHDDMPEFAEAEIHSIQFAGSSNYQIDYEEESKDTYCEEDVYFTERDGKNCPLDSERVDDYLSMISNLDPTEYVTYDASEEEIESYGLDDPELTVTVQYTPEDDEDTEEKENKKQTFVINVSRDPEEADKETKEEQKEDDEEEEEEITAYARVGESSIIYLITGEQYQELMKASYDDLRHQEVLSADFADITQIDISLEGEDYTITCEGKGDDRTYYYGEEELEIDDLKSALMALTADSFTEEEPKGKEEISLTVHLDNENYPEVTVKLCRYDGSYCLAVVDGEPVSLVKRDQVIDLVEAVNAIVLN